VRREEMRFWMRVNVAIVDRKKSVWLLACRLDLVGDLDLESANEAVVVFSVSCLSDHHYSDYRYDP
jgi:hypothetical protein